jgi:hypothetical protein
VRCGGCWPPPSRLTPLPCPGLPDRPPTLASCAARISALVTRAAVAMLLGAAPASAAAAAAARAALPLAPAARGLGVRISWLSAAALAAIKGKVRLQAQLRLSAFALAAACAAAAHDALLSPAPARGGAAAALLCAIFGEALHCGLVYVWDDHLRAEFLRQQAGSRGGAHYPAARTAVAPPKSKAA